MWAAAWNVERRVMLNEVECGFWNEVECGMWNVGDVE